MWLDSSIGVGRRCGYFGLDPSQYCSGLYASSASEQRCHCCELVRLDPAIQHLVMQGINPLSHSIVVSDSVKTILCTPTDVRADGPARPGLSYPVLIYIIQLFMSENV